MTRFWKGGLFMTKLFCGIDVAKYEHVASIYDPSTGEIMLDSLLNIPSIIKRRVNDVESLCQ